MGPSSAFCRYVQGSIEEAYETPPYGPYDLL